MRSFSQTTTVVDTRQRRFFSATDKARIVAESVSTGNVSATARRHNVAPNLIGKWRKALGLPGPVSKPVIELPGVPNSPPLEIAIGGLSIRVGQGVPMSLVSSVLEVLRAA